MLVVNVIVDRYGHCNKQYWSTYGQSQALLYRLPPSLIGLFQTYSVTNGTQFQFNIVTFCTCTIWLSKINDLLLDLTQSCFAYVFCLKDLSHHDQCLGNDSQSMINVFLISCVQGCIPCALLASVCVEHRDETRQILHIFGCDLLSSFLESVELLTRYILIVTDTIMSDITVFDLGAFDPPTICWGKHTKSREISQIFNDLFCFELPDEAWHGLFINNPAAPSLGTRPS